MSVVDVFPFDLRSQSINVCSMLLLLTSFAIVAQRRLSACVSLYAFQSFLLALTAVVVAFVTGLHHLYIAAALNLGVKVLVIPRILSRIVARLNVKREVEPLVNIPSSLLISGGLVVLSLYLAEPIMPVGPSLTNDSLALGLAIILIGCFTMLTRREPVNQIIGFLVIENGIFLVATALAYGMPLIVELGVFFDLLVAALIVGVMLQRIQDTVTPAEAGERVVERWRAAL